jgi:hypothetical protein
MDFDEASSVCSVGGIEIEAACLGSEKIGLTRTASRFLGISARFRSRVRGILVRSRPSKASAMSSSSSGRYEIPATAALRIADATNRVVLISTES